MPGFGVTGLGCRVEGPLLSLPLPCSLSMVGEPVREKGETTSPRMGKGWQPQADPRTQVRRQGAPSGRESCKRRLELGTDKPSNPCTWPGRGSKEAFLRSVSWGQVPLSSSAPEPAPHSPQGPAEPKPGRGMGQATELHDLLSPVCAPAVPDLVSPRLPTLSKSHRLWVGLLGRLGGARVRMSQRASGGARPLISQAVLGEGVALERPPPPSWGGSRQGQKGFSGSSPPTGGKGPGRPRARWVCDGAGGTPARTGPTNPRLHSRRARLPAARLARGGGARTPGRAAVTGQKPRRGGGGRRAAGGRDHLGAARQWEAAASPRGGRAWPGPAPLISVLSPLLRDLDLDLDGPAAAAGSSAGSFACP